MKKSNFFAVIATGIALTIALASCASETKVDRVSPDKTTDYSGYWNDTDVRLVANQIIKDFNSSSAIKNYPKEHNGNIPIVIVGTYRNGSDEHIDTTILVDYLQAELIEDRNVKFVASNPDRTEVKAERDYQQENASEETRKKLKNETGADYMMQGSIRTIIDTMDNGKKTSRTYYVVTQLVDIETNEILWKNDNRDIKKIITRSDKRS